MVTVIIIVVLCLVVLALILTPPGHAIRTAPRRLRGGKPEGGRERQQRPFRRPRPPKP
jgi:hypothetical protein